MVRRFVYGVYSTEDEARESVTTLTDAGVPRSALTVVAADSVVANYRGDLNMISSKEYYESTEQDKPNWFARIFGFNSRSNMQDDSDIDLNRYEQSLQDEDILILVESKYRDQVGTSEGPAYSQYSPYDALRDGPDTNIQSKNLRTAQYGRSRPNAEERRYDRPE